MGSYVCIGQLAGQGLLISAPRAEKEFMTAAIHDSSVRERKVCCNDRIPALLGHRDSLGHNLSNAADLQETRT